MDGAIIYVVSPSGAGKDSIIRAAEQFFFFDEDVVFAKSFVTRKADSSEAHISLTGEQFMLMEVCGAFLFHWASRGLRYGIPAWAKDEACAGRIVIVNSSREYLPKARQICPELRVVSVAAPENVLRKRLLSRGRENAVDEFVNYIMQFKAQKMYVVRGTSDRVPTTTHAIGLFATHSGFCELGGGCLKRYRIFKGQGVG